MLDLKKCKDCLYFEDMSQTNKQLKCNNENINNKYNKNGLHSIILSKIEECTTSFKEKPFMKYENGIFLGDGVDMAHNKYKAYRFENEIHILYKSGHVAIENIDKIKDDLDAYLWTPYIQWI